MYLRYLSKHHTNPFTETIVIESLCTEGVIVFALHRNSAVDVKICYVRHIGDKITGLTFNLSCCQSELKYARCVLLELLALHLAEVDIVWS